MSVTARAGIRQCIAFLIIGVVLFAAAGDLSWRPAWAYMAVLAAGMVLSLAGPLRLDEGLIEERMSRKAEAKRWDKYFVSLVGVFTIAELLVPAFLSRALFLERHLRIGCFRWNCPGTGTMQTGCRGSW